MTEAEVEAPVKLELRPKLGLAAAHIGALPWIQVKVKNKKGQSLSCIHSRILSLVVTPDTHSILYLECVSTSSAVAHAILAASVENSGTVQKWSFCPDKRHGFDLNLPDTMRVSDLKLSLKGHAGLHHFALISQEGSFIFSDSDEQLWAKLRQKMGCPSKPEWITKMMPKVMEAGLLLECETFGLPVGMKAYILDLDSEATWDRLCGEHVRRNGL
jgi:hypothetical protein